MSREKGILTGFASHAFGLASEIPAYFSVVRVYDATGNVIETHEHQERVLRLLTRACCRSD